MRTIVSLAAAAALAGIVSIMPVLTAPLALTTPASAATINFSDGTLDAPSNTYSEDGFVFSPASLTSGQCPGEPECILLNTGALSEVEMTTESGLPFNLFGFSFQFVGNGGVLTVTDTYTETFTQAIFGNDPFTVVFTNEFLGVSEIIFSYSGGASGRLDDVTAQVVPLPGGVVFFLTGLLGIGFLGRYKLRQNLSA